jgi:hypothetical protein
MIDEQIAMLRTEIAATRIEIATLQTTVNLLVEQNRVLYEGITHLHDRMATELTAKTPSRRIKRSPWLHFPVVTAMLLGANYEPFLPCIVRRSFRLSDPLDTGCAGPCAGAH